jgi:WW domain-binding protein 11
MQQRPLQALPSTATTFSAPVHYDVAAAVTAAKPPTAVAPTISAEPQLRDLQKELLGFVPAALRRKQTQAKKHASLPKEARPTINAAPSIDQQDEQD